MLSERAGLMFIPIVLFACAGAARGQVVTWTGAAGSNWYDYFQSGTCLNGTTRFINNFNQIGCQSPVFPDGSNFVVVGAGLGPIIDRDLSVGGMSLAQGGTITCSSVELNFGTAPSGGFTNGGYLVLRNYPGFTQFLRSSTILNTGTIENASAGYNFVNTTMTNPGTIRWVAGGWYVPSGSPSSLSSSGTIEKIGSGSFSTNLNTTLSGLLDVKNGKLVFSGPGIAFQAPSNITLGPGATLEFQNGSLSGLLKASVGAGSLRMGFISLNDDLTLEATGGQGMTLLTGDLSLSSKKLTNAGLLTISGISVIGGINTTSVSNGTILNTGTIEDASNASCNFVNTTMTNLGTIRWVSGGWTNYIGSNSLSSSGTIEKIGPGFFGTSLNTTLSGLLDVKSGSVSFSGGFNLVGPGATFRTTISGASTAGQLAINNSPVTLKGTLAVYFDPSFTPTINQSWVVLTSPSITGTFDSVVPVAFPAGRQIQVIYSPTAVTVKLLATGCVGDLNADGQVDDEDFVLFAFAYNILDCADPAMPPGCLADMNGDAAVDDADFVLFASAYNELICP